MNQRILFAAVLTVYGFGYGSVLAQSGDTTIRVSFQLASVRVRPSYLVGGTTFSLEVTLRPDRRVDVTSSTVGPRGRSLAQTSVLGQGFRVVNDRMIERVIQAQSHTERLTITVSGGSCTARLQQVLKPGYTEYLLYSSQLGQNAWFSSNRVVSSTCSIN